MSRPTWLAIGLPDTTIAFVPSVVRALPRYGQVLAIPETGPIPDD
jgi:hypothetical protein